MSIQLKSFVDDRGELCKRVDFRTNATEIMSAPEVSNQLNILCFYI